MGSRSAIGGGEVFFFNDTATTEIYTLSLPDALPISPQAAPRGVGGVQDHQEPPRAAGDQVLPARAARGASHGPRSEEHTSELQSQSNLVCRLLLEKKNQPQLEAAHAC